MLKKYQDRLPEYSVWRYDGEEIVPLEIFNKLRDCGYSFRIVTHQYKTDAMTATVQRQLEVSKSNHETFTVEEGEYLVFTDYHFNTFLRNTASRTHSLDRYTEIAPLSNG